MSATPGPGLSRYRIERKLGEGGMGVVYRALDTRLQRPVAIKFLVAKPGEADEAARRFLREARSAAALNHPNICTIHEVGEIDPGAPPDLPEEAVGPGTSYLVMELIDGETLESRLQRDGPLPLRSLLDVATQVAEGLREAHTKGLVHRDLKPLNVMVGAGGRVKILDFGLATPWRPPAGGADGGSSETTVSVAAMPEGGFAGTIAYMSPEQAQGGALDQRSDLFSLGTMLYEMAGGVAPFRASNPMATVAKVLESEPQALTSLRPELPDELGEIVARCLRKDPAERFADAGELIEALGDLRRAVREGRLRSPEACCPISPDRIAVLPFTVRGDASLAYLSEGMVDLLSTKLDGAGELRVADAHVVLGSISRRGDTAMNPEAGRTIARRFGCGLFVLGTLVEVGGHLQLEAALYDAVEDGTPGIVARGSVEGATARIFELVDRLSVALLADRCDDRGKRLTKIAAMTTESFPALKAYLAGEREMRAMRREPAVERFQAAVDADPSFALAWYRLSVATLWSRQPEKAWEAGRRALEHADRLSPRDRSLVEAFHALLQGRNEEAERRYLAVVGDHPDDAEAWYQLADLQFHLGPQRGRPLTESLESWERLLQLDPDHVAALIHLAAVAASVGDREDLASSAERFLELSPEADPAGWLRVLRAFALEDDDGRQRAVDELRLANDLSVHWSVRFVGAYLGDLDGAARLSGLLTESVRAPEVRALGHVLLAHLELSRGRWGVAERELERAGARHEACVIEYGALMAATPFHGLSRQVIAGARQRVRDWRPQERCSEHASGMWIAPHQGLRGLLRDYLHGLLSARLGEVDEASASAERMEAWSGPEWSAPLVADLAGSVRAAAAQAAGDVSRALRHLEAGRMEVSLYRTLWSPFFSQAYERFARAELLHESGRHEEALPWYGSFAENSIFDLIYEAPSHFRRGQIFEHLGRPRRAAAHYVRFLRLWRGADDLMCERVQAAADRLKELRG